MDTGGFMKKSLEPVVNDKTEILILGSMPSDESIKKQEYYANPRNQFWKIMGQLYDFDPTISYAARVEQLLRNHVGLWDSLESCERKGSSDSAITDGTPNEIGKLLDNYLSINTIVFNGKKSAEEYDKHIERFDGVKYFIMPSTSSANATPFKKKLDEWEKINT